MTNSTVVIGRMTEIALVGDIDIAFRRIRETLTRIGVPSKEDGKDVLFQTCHILHKRGSYFLTHFKNMLALDGKEDRVTSEDLSRQHTVAKLLSDWGMITVLNKPDDLAINPKNVKVIKHHEISKWILRPKYNIGSISGAKEINRSISTTIL